MNCVRGLRLLLLVAVGVGGLCVTRVAVGAGHPERRTAADPDVAILYGKGYSFALRTPRGWELDTESAKGNGLDAVLYPKGSAWATTKVAMYPNTTLRNAGDTRTFRERIEADVTPWKKDGKTEVVKDAPPIMIDGHRQAVVKYFLGGTSGLWQACAYIEEPHVDVLLVLGVKKKELFDENVSAFREWVGSYRYLADMVEVVK